MAQIEPKILEAIDSFVSKEQSFISLDIYCLLGVRIENDKYPIHQQVRDAFIAGIMPNYLSEWTTLTLEGGGYASVWRYYLPKASVKTVPLPYRADGRIELTKEALGHFPLLETELGILAKKGMIKLSLNTVDTDQIITDTQSRIRLGKTILEKAKLLDEDYLIAKVYQDRIEITKGK